MTNHDHNDILHISDFLEKSKYKSTASMLNEIHRFRMWQVMNNTKLITLFAICTGFMAAMFCVALCLSVILHTIVYTIFAALILGVYAAGLYTKYLDQKRLAEQKLLYYEISPLKWEEK